MSNETTNNVRNNSTANFEFTIGEVEFKGITLKNLKMSAHADITDENVKISTDGAVGLLKAIFTFADAKVDKVIEHQMKMDVNALNSVTRKSKPLSKSPKLVLRSTRKSPSIGKPSRRISSRTIRRMTRKKITTKSFFGTELGYP